MNRKYTPSRLVMYFVLFLMLAASAGNYLFVRYAFNPEEREATAPAAPHQPSIVATGGTDGPQKIADHPLESPRIVGHITITRIEGLRYAITLTAIDNTHTPLPLKSFSADVRLPGSTTPVEVPVFKKTDTATYEAEVTLPNAGSWEVRARMISEHESLEFYERFDIP